jgi:hypothetical protein
MSDNEVFEQKMNNHNEDEDRSFDFREFKKKASEYVKNNIYVLCALAVCIVYVFTSFTSLIRSSKSIWDIIGDVASGFAFAFAIARLLEGNGILEGKRDKEYTEALKEYKMSLLEAKKHYSKLQAWCLKYSKQHYYNRLDEMLITTGLTHKEFIANQYRMSDYSENQQKAIEKAKAYNPIVITVEYLTSGATPNKNGEVDYTKVSVQNYVKKSSKNDVISKFVVAIIFGYWVLVPLAQLQWSAVVWALAKAIIFLAFGVMKGFSGKIFVLEKLKTKVLDITAKLNLFVSDITEEENKEETSNGK